MFRMHPHLWLRPLRWRTFPATSVASRTKRPAWATSSACMDKQTILFITGTRPLDQFGDFVKKLNMACIGDWINALSAQYNEMAG